MKSSFPQAAVTAMQPRWLAWLPTRLRSRLAGRTGVHAVIANSGWLILDRVVRAFVGLLIGAWVARYLGPSNYGMLAYVLAYVAMFQAFANVGADSIVVRDLAQRPDAAPEILGSALVLRLVFGVACWVLAVLCTVLVSGADRQIVALSAIASGVLVFQAGDVFDLWFQSRSLSRLTVVAKLASYLVTTGIKVALILHQAPLIAFAWVFVLETLMSTIALVVAYRRCRTPRPWRVLRRTAFDILSEAWPFMLSGFAIMAYARLDQIMVKEILGPRELGIYAAVLPISQFWQVIPLTAAVSIAPVIARRKLADEATYLRTLVLVFRAFFYAGVATAVVTLVVSGPLVQALFGARYADGAPVLAIHSVSNIFCFLGVAHGLWLVNERRFAVRLYGTVLAAFTALAMNFLLLPRMGVIGAAYSAIAAQFVAAFLINLFLDPQSFRLQCDAILFRKGPRPC